MSILLQNSLYKDNEQLIEDPESAKKQNIIVTCKNLEKEYN